MLLLTVYLRNVSKLFVIDFSLIFFRFFVSFHSKDYPLLFILEIFVLVRIVIFKFLQFKLNSF